MSISTSLRVVLGCLLLLSPSWGFDVTTPDQAPTLEGRTVYPFVTTCIDKSKDVYVFAGEPLQATTFERRDSGEPMLHNLGVKTEDGREGQIDIEKLSTTPLSFNLRQPGKPEELIIKMVAEALPVAEALQAVQKENGYRPSGYRQNSFGNSVKTDAAFRFETHKAYLKSLDWHVRALVRGCGSRRENIIEDPKYQWAVKAQDPAVLAWFCSGVSDPQAKSRWANACLALGSLNNLPGLGDEAAGATGERRAELEKLLEDCVPQARARQAEMLNPKVEPKRETEAERTARAERDRAATEDARAAAIAEGQRKVQEELAKLRGGAASPEGGVTLPDQGGSGGALAVAIIVLLLGGGGYFVYRWRRPTRKAPTAPTVQVPKHETPAPDAPAAPAAPAVDAETLAECIAEAKPIVIAMIKAGRITRENGQKALGIYKRALSQGKRVTVEQVIAIKNLAIAQPEEQPV